MAATEKDASDVELHEKAGRKPPRFTDTTLRDGHQSTLATRLRGEDIFPVAEEMDKAGFWSMEVWGGATFDVPTRFLNEDPWERLKRLKSLVRNTPLQMLLRGQNLVGYRQYADDVVEAFVDKAAEHGIDVFRIFDALNDIRNLRTAARACRKAGKHVQGTICYSLTERRMGGPIYNLAYYLNMARDLEEMGVDSIVVKDMAGILAPFDAYELIRALRETVSVPIHLHTHYTSGMGSMTYLKAIEAGAHVLDTCLAPFALRSSQPALEPIVVALEGTEWDTGLDLDHLLRLGQYLEGIAPKYRDHLAKTGMAVIDTGVLKHQVPGGMLSNLVSQLKEAKALDRIQEVFEELPRTRKELGYPPLVTPSSQLVGIQAVENVLFGRYRMVPSQIKDYAFGLYGRPPRPVEPEVQRICLKGYERGEQPIDCRPADILEPEMGKARQALKDMTEKEEDVLTYALFPTTGLRFLKWQYGLEKPPSEVTPNTLDDVRREDELIEKAKAGLLVERGEKGEGETGPAPARDVPDKGRGREEVGQGIANVLVAVDGSEQSFEAVRYVSRLFGPGQARFTLLHVIDRVPDVYWDLHTELETGYEGVGVLQWRSEKQRYMERFFEQCRGLFDEAGHPAGSAGGKLQEKKVGIARDIAEEARNGYDALVVGRKGLNPLKDALFGGVANKLVGRPLHLPVWVVGGAPPVDKLLVALDRSEQSRRTVACVEKILASVGRESEVLLFNVIRGKRTFLPDVGDPNALHQEEDWVKRAIQEFDKVKSEMQGFFDEVIRGWETNGLHRGRTDSRISWGESRAGTIVDQARRGGYGTIVVGRKGVTRVEEFFLGRVSSKVLQLAKDMAVWVVP